MSKQILPPETVQMIKFPSNYMPREVKPPLDYGDDKTIMISLKRRGKNFHDLSNDDFGIYLGAKKVGVKNFPGYDIKYIEAFDTEEEMKNEWEID